MALGTTKRRAHGKAAATEKPARLLVSHLEFAPCALWHFRAQAQAMRSAVMTAENIIQENVLLCRALRKSQLCFPLLASGASTEFVKQQPRSFSTVVTWSHLQEAPGKEKGKRGSVGVEEGSVSVTYGTEASELNCPCRRVIRNAVQ